MFWLKISLLLLATSTPRTSLGLTLWSDKETKLSGCNITLKTDLASPSPLLLRPCFNYCGNSTKLFLGPDPGAVVTLAPGQKLRLACPGVDNYVSVVGGGVHLVEAVCASGSKFTVEGRTFHLRDLHCETTPVQVARTNGRCFNSTSSSLEVGFQVGTYGLVKTMDICFDVNTKHTLWSRFELVAEVLNAETGGTSPGFAADSFFPGLDPDNLYKPASQRALIGKILGSDDLAKLYVPLDDSNYLSRGHLTANADFVYDIQRKSTYRYVNVAPQWRSLNGGNWATMENNVRKEVSERGLDVIVYTGTYGVMRLPDVNNVTKEIWLSIDENNNYEMPAPEVFWKIVYEPIGRVAIGLFSVNNPYLVERTTICAEVTCPSWIKWKQNNQTLGYSYCCAVDVTLRSTVVPSLPDFTVVGILT